MTFDSRDYGKNLEQILTSKANVCILYSSFGIQALLSHGLLNRWTSQYDWGITTGGLTFNLNNGTKTHLIIVKLLENTFLGMTKVRAWPILTLAMP